MKKNVLRGTNSKIILIGKINGLAAQSKKTRIRLLKKKSDKNIKYAYTKYVIGLDIRHHLLAYAFLRGAEYHSLEKTCRLEHQPNAESILRIVHAHVSVWETSRLTLETIQDWLKGE